jgi:integrase
MANNIELRRNTWFATLHVPSDVQHVIGKSKLFETLKTTDKRVAESRAAPLVALWKARIAAARGQSDSFLDAALRWRRDHEDNANPDAVRDHIEIEAKKLAEVKGDTAGASFYAIATGMQEPLLPHYTDWAALLKLSPKTMDQMKKDVRVMVKQFGTVEKITTPNVRDWIKELILDSTTRKGFSTTSIKRIVGSCRNFWVYLQEIQKADVEKQPFVVPTFAKKTGSKPASQRGGWVPFTPAEVVFVLGKAEANEDDELVDLIQLGMYSGARIEEMCALKASACTEEVLKIDDSKTEAGIRTVPVHSKLVPIVRRLKEATKGDPDAYLLQHLTMNKYGDRSNAIGKRFGRLKQKLGFPGNKVFHSIRGTVITQLENAGVLENLAADIVGHEKPRITYGLYSEGNSVETMREALEKLNYPF